MEFVYLNSLNWISMLLIVLICALSEQQGRLDGQPLHLSMLSCRGGGGGGRPGISGVFDVRRLPVAEALDHCDLWVGTFDFNR